MWKSLLGLGILAACFETAALPKAVCFRYDDNQTVEKYSVLAETFLKNNARFSMSLIPFSSPVESAEWRKMVCRLAGLGFEIMDHTPRHSTLSFSLGKDDPLLKKAMGAPFVHHITNNRVCLKYDMTGSVWSKPIAAEVRNGNIISPLPEFKIRRVIEIDGQYFYVVPGKFKLLSIWAEDNVRLQDGKKQVRMCLSSLVPYPGAAEFLVEVSREGFSRIGLKKMPVVWVQPGGYYPALETAGMSRVLKKYGYVSATTQPGILKGFGSPDIETRRFALDWGDFNFERQSVEEIKTCIADIVACRRVAIGSSHFRIKCSLAEYAAQHDQVLKWLKKNNIQVMTQSQIALLLKNTPIPAGKNIFPALDCDLDNNGRPDGYFATAGVKFQKSSIIISGAKETVWIKSLCGLPRGKVRLTVDHLNFARGSVSIKFYDSYRKPCGNWKMDIRSGAGKVKSDTAVLNIPAGCAAVDFEIIKLGGGKAQIDRLTLCGE